MPKLLTIAVDFDGTLVENQYPEIGKPILFAFETLKALQEAVNFCEARGITFYAVNKSYPEEVYDQEISRKILADLFIDDRNINGLPPWGEIFHQLTNKSSAKPKVQKKKNGLLNFLKK